MSRKSAIVAAALAHLACSRGESRDEPRAQAAHAGAESTSAVPTLQAEFERNRALVSDAALIDAEPRRRQAAVRTLARIADPADYSRLVAALLDEDTSVVSSAAFGLGLLCRGQEAETVRKLSLRAASLAALGGGSSLAARSAIAAALGRCATVEAERTLAAWLALEPPLAEAAAFALGRVARERLRLDAATLASVLTAAAPRDAPARLLSPIEPVPSLSAAVRARLLEVAVPKLAGASAETAFAVRALAKAGPEASQPLARVLTSTTADVGARSEAARALSRLGRPGQVALCASLAELRAIGESEEAVVSSRFGVLLEALNALGPTSADAPALVRLAQLPLGPPGPRQRRQIMLRCRAAALRAQRDHENPELLACDADAEGREGRLARLRVLSRGALEGRRARAFYDLARARDVVVREAALELLASHDEVQDAPALLSEALTSEVGGVRATAAKLLSRYPTLARLPRSSPRDSTSAALDPGLVSALLAALARVPNENDVELGAWLIDAAAALELLGAKPVLEHVCTSDAVMLREHAELALHRLGDAKRHCPLVPSPSPLPAGRASGHAQITLQTDVGELALELDGDRSPFAVTRVLELVRAGFYDGLAVHRVVPGFVVQFGDRDGDGFGGADLPPLRGQTGDEPFEAGSLGVAIAERDTGSSQLFVTLRRAPPLDGEYTWIGQARGDWTRLAPGDRILSARASP